MIPNSIPFPFSIKNKGLLFSKVGVKSTLLLLPIMAVINTVPRVIACLLQMLPTTVVNYSSNADF